MDLSQVIADAREEGAVLRRNGAGMSPGRLEELLGNIERAAEDYLRFDAESDARLYSGKSREWLRARFPDWELQGHARKVGTVRYYRRLVLPRRPDLVAAREAGRRGARPESEVSRVG